jgi:hypothetical protein
MTKTFKIGERCVGGILKVVIKNNIKIYCLDYNTKEEIYSKEFNIVFGGISPSTERDMRIFIEDLSTSFHAEKIMKYIANNLKN